MNIKCLFGKHDWAEVECVSEEYIINNLLEPEIRSLAKSIAPTRTIGFRWYMPGDRLNLKLRKYVCLREDCCEIKDEVKKHLDYFRTEWLKKSKQRDEIKRRNEKAKKKFESCLKEKE